MNVTTSCDLKQWTVYVCFSRITFRDNWLVTLYRIKSLALRSRASYLQRCWIHTIADWYRWTIDFTTNHFVLNWLSCNGYNLLDTCFKLLITFCLPTTKGVLSFGKSGLLIAGILVIWWRYHAKIHWNVLYYSSESIFYSRTEADSSLRKAVFFFLQKSRQ